MNVSRTYTYIIFSAFIILFCLSLFAGIIIGRRRGNTEITESQLVIDRLGKTVTILNESISITRFKNERLRKLYETDKKTIGKLEITNKEITRIISKQERIIKELTEGNRKIGITSGSIRNGLGYAIEEINSIIKDIQAREN